VPSIRRGGSPITMGHRSPLLYNDADVRQISATGVLHMMVPSHTQTLPLKTHMKLDSMRWLSHRRSLSPQGGHAMVSSVVACCVRPSYGARPTMHCQWRRLSTFSFFVPGDLDLWPLTFDIWPLTFTFELGREFCTLYTWPPSLIVLRLVVQKLSCG